uniref:Transposase (Putative), gypsy type n=1 Tax=Tanacetum cinerariifolium TaxID=118510 RepID=A0A699GQA9_TANCI|nr:transposase (putative), gypsy type [Tanacetum cinerariifolium]
MMMMMMMIMGFEYQMNRDEPEWDPCRERVRDYRDCGREFPFANASRSVDDFVLLVSHVFHPPSLLASPYLTIITYAFCESYPLADLVDYTYVFSSCCSLLLLCQGMKSILTQSALDALCETFHIPDTVYPKLLGPNDRIRNSPPLSVIAAAKVSHFEILCRVHGFVPTVDSLKHWDDHFFWVDASIFPLDVLWHNNKTLRKDPHPTTAKFNANVCDYLADNLAPFRKLPEPFLCFVGISRYYDLDENCYPTFWAGDDEEMDLVSFINHADPTKNEVVQDEGVHAVNEESGDVTVADQVGQSDHVIHVRGFEIVEGDEVGITAMATLTFITSYVSITPEREGGGHTDSITGPNLRTQRTSERFIVLSDSSHHSSTNAADDEVTSIFRSSVPPPLTVATTTIVDATSTPTPSAGTEPVPCSIFRDSTSTGEANQDVAVLPTPLVQSFPRIHFLCRKMWTQRLFARHTFLNEMLPMILLLMTLISAVVSLTTWLLLCFSPSSSAWTMHNCLLNFMSKRPVRHALAPKLGCGWSMNLGVAEASDAIHLCSQVATVEAAQASRANELNVLKERNSTLEEEKGAFESKVVAFQSADVTKVVELASLTAQVAKITKDLSELGLSCDEPSIKAFSLKVEKDRLVGQVSSLEGICSGLCNEVTGYKLFKKQTEAVQDEQVRVFSEKVAGLDSELMAIGRDIDKGIQNGLATGIDHGKAGRDLAEVAAYNLVMEANYVSVVNALRVVDFPLLALLASYKDASMSDLMDLLRLEGPAVETPEANQFHPAPEQLMLPIHRQEDQVANIVPPILVADGEVLGPGPSTKVPPHSNVVFEKEEMETTASVTSYGPSHLGLSFPLSFAWMASLFWYTGSPGLKLVLRTLELKYFSIFALLLASRIVSCSLISFKRSRLISKALSFYAMSISVVLKTCGISSIQSLLLSFSPASFLLQAYVCSFYQAIGLRVLDGGKALADVQLFTPIFEWVVPKLLSVI